MLQSSTATAIADDLAQLRRLGRASFVEATTLLVLLLVAVPLKHLLGYALATRIMGPVHGAAFVAYIWSMIATVSTGDWSRREIARLSLAAFIPFGGFFNTSLLRRKRAILVAELKRRP